MLRVCPNLSTIRFAVLLAMLVCCFALSSPGCSSAGAPSPSPMTGRQCLESNLGKILASKSAAQSPKPGRSSQALIENSQPESVSSSPGHSPQWLCTSAVVVSEPDGKSESRTQSAVKPQWVWLWFLVSIALSVAVAIVVLRAFRDDQPRQQTPAVAEGLPVARGGVDRVDGGSGALD